MASPTAPLPGSVAVGGSRTRDIAAVIGVLVVVVAAIVSVAVLRHGGSAALFEGVPASTRSPVPDRGSDFIESNGSYSLRVGDDWDRVDIASGAAWYTGTGSRTFRDNVAVIIEDLPTRLSLADYVTLSVSNASRGNLGFVEQRRDPVVLSDGRDAILIDYTSSQRGFDLRHRLVVTVHDLVAVSVTFTSENTRFDAAVLGDEPYLRTINLR